MRVTAGEVWTNSLTTLSYKHLYIRTLDAVWKTFQEWLIIGTDRELRTVGLILFLFSDYCSEIEAILIYLIKYNKILDYRVEDLFFVILRNKDFQDCSSKKQKEVQF